MQFKRLSIRPTERGSPSLLKRKTSHYWIAVFPKEIWVWYFSLPRWAYVLGTINGVLQPYNVTDPAQVSVTYLLYIMFYVLRQDVRSWQRISVSICLGTLTIGNSRETTLYVPGERNNVLSSANLSSTQFKD